MSASASLVMRPDGYHFTCPGRSVNWLQSPQHSCEPGITSSPRTDVRTLFIHSSASQLVQRGWPGPGTAGGCGVGRGRANRPSFMCLTSFKLRLDNFLIN